MKKYIPLILAVVFIGLGVILRDKMPKPYVWILTFPAFAAAFACFAAFAQSSLLKYLCIGLMSLLLAMGVFEAYLCLGERIQEETHVRKVSIEEIRKERNRPDLQDYQSNLTFNDPVLGYRPKPMKVQTATKLMYDDKVIYDAVYSTLETGWRVTPQHPEAEYAVVIFGCSYVFGYGLNDEETFPYKMGEMLGEHYQVFNFAYSGYGSHHMLAQIQNDFLADIAARYKKTLVFFVTISGHELRSAGFSTWDRRGPWYALENGEVVHKGRFTDRNNFAIRAMQRLLRNSLAYRALTEARQDNLGQYRDLHIAILEKADKELQSRYDTRLTTVLWPGTPYLDTVTKAGIPVLDLQPYFPGYVDDTSAQYSIPHDGHPNALATDIAAKVLTDYVKDIEK